MARASASWTNTIAGDWDPGTLIETDDFLVQILQDIEHIAQTHNHDADTANMGGRLRVKEGKDILLLLGASG